MSGYAKTQEAKGARVARYKDPNSVGTQQISVALKASGEYAAEHGRGKLKESSSNRLKLFKSRRELLVVTTELSSGFKQLQRMCQRH